MKRAAYILVGAAMLYPVAYASGERMHYDSLLGPSVEEIAATEARAEGGDAVAQCDLGYLYRYGSNVPLDYRKAFQWFMKAAGIGSAEAQRNVGQLYYEGQGIFQDYGKAFEWFTKAAEQGDARAQFALGSMHHGGRSVPQDYKKAFEWYMKAARQGCKASQYDVGAAFFLGEGVAQDFVRAHAWMSMASMDGYEPALRRRAQLAEHLSPEALVKAQSLAAQLAAEIEKRKAEQ